MSDSEFDTQNGPEHTATNAADATDGTYAIVVDTPKTLAHKRTWRRGGTMTTAKRAAQFPGDMITQGNDMLCKWCWAVVKWEETLYEKGHLKSAKHKKAKEHACKIVTFQTIGGLYLSKLDPHHSFPRVLHPPLTQVCAKGCAMPSFGKTKSRKLTKKITKNHL